MLAVDRQRLEDANADNGPFFSICNSGAPDRNCDLRELRGRVFSGTRESAVEVVFRDAVRLPAGTQVWNRHSSGWIPLERATFIEPLTTLVGEKT